MYSRTVARLAASLAFLISIPAVRARPFITATSPLGPDQLDSGIYFSQQQHRIEEHGGNTEGSGFLYRTAPSHSVADGPNVEWDPAIVINPHEFGAGDLDYIEELEEERQRWMADQRYMREADAIKALEDDQLWNDFGENNHRNRESNHQELAYLDRMRQVIQGLICLLPDKAKQYTTCPKSTRR
ncbi:hypothetical protein V1525DRAFT_408531 [Lipomyces kononenkoae]|uniref:Uncharacterized protein n=1 Tax=Lipomyces kononenkoae TaxID=34357 RepID=A0ACC3SX32_LIPKO